MTIPIGAAVHANFVGELFGQTIMTGLWLQSAVDGQTMASLATALSVVAQTELRNATPADVTWKEIVCFDPRKDGDATHHRTIAPPNEGLLAGASMPGQNTVRTKLTTGFKSARRRGATLFPALTEESHITGNLVDPQLSAIIAYHAVLMNLFGPTGSNTSWDWVTYSPENLTVTPPRVGTLMTPVLSTATDSRVRTIHRRQIGIGV